MLPLRRLSWACRRRGLAQFAAGTPREAADAVVVGAGAVGLAVARALAMAGREVVVVEAASSFGRRASAAPVKAPVAGMRARALLRRRRRDVQGTVEMEERERGWMGG